MHTTPNMWPRDGALVSFALDRVGLSEITRPFFEFCARVLPKDRAALMHKYGPHCTVGASWHPWFIQGEGPEIPFQEDGTALVVWSFRQHFAPWGSGFRGPTLPPADAARRRLSPPPCAPPRN